MLRPQSELDGLWDFALVTRGTQLPHTYDRQLAVPGCWECTPGLETYRGKAAYRKMITLPCRANLRLEFKGVSHTADVYFDGKRVAHHYNAYTPFSVVLPNVKQGNHTVEVLADNTFGAHSALHIPNDYYSYGGITRPVVVETVPDVFIERVVFVPACTGKNWQADIRLIVNNIGRAPVKVRLQVTLAGQIIELPAVSIRPGKQTVKTRTAFTAVKPWGSSSPHLYTLKTLLFIDGREQPVDDLIERVGFREMKLVGRKLVINGKPFFLKGFNRHEDHGQFGCAIPFPSMVKDLELMRDMGANAVRTCHYPNDELFLDLCDELGVYVWEENHARGLDLEQMEHPLFDQQCADCNREMVEYHVNHPAIVIWGVLNECASHTPAGAQKYARQFKQIRALDPSRPVTFATCHPFTDRCLGREDIVSLNLYARWYGDTATGPHYLRIKKWLEKAGGQGKPVILSEFGAAALYGFHENTRVKWSEERQADILKECIEVYGSRPEITGLFIWQFADCRVVDGKWSLTRTRGRNNKGVVDEHRRPKLAYETVKKLYTAIKR
jgi:beta-glucuronidase